MEKYVFGKAVLSLDDRGHIDAAFTEDQVSLLPEETGAQPFLQLGIKGVLFSPDCFVKKGSDLIFTFENRAEVWLSYTQKDSYAVFKVKKVPNETEVIVFGPFFSSLNDIIGDVVGVVQGGEWAVGVQALNSKTLAGFPVEYRQYASPYVSAEPLSQLSVDSFTYYDSAAYAAEAGEVSGSMLQLYCENRRRPRVKKIMSFSNVPVKPMGDHPDAGIEGAAFALFCCPKEQALETIGQIETGEGLPHPMLDGEWAKISRKAMKSYLIAEFNPDNFDELLARTKQAGFENLYHPEPFSDWGHFTLRNDCFPNGDTSLTEYCATAEKQSVKIGLHTLSAFTTPDDSYVSPVPDSRLAKLGESVLAQPISETDDCFNIENITPFRTVTSLQTVQVGTELIRYREVSDGKLVGCQRGAWGTSAAFHKAGEAVELLCDHPYKVFFPDLELQEEYSRRIGGLFHKTGAAQISFDGLEGCAATGEDAYGINRFCLDCWDGWQRPDVINDASRLNHNLWHMHTRMNWGEPWGAKMREGQLDARIKNQDFFQRNLFPRMLGWFLIRKADRRFEATPPEDMEWALSMAAGFDAGFALSASASVLSLNGCTDALLEAIKSWEELRLANAFPEELRKRLRDPKTEWHLEKTEDGKFLLYPLFVSEPYVCDLLELQPGQPGGADWVLENPYAAQPFDLRMRVEGNGEIHEPSFITQSGILKIPCTVKGGQYLWIRGGKAVITDRNYRTLQEVSPVGYGIAETGRQVLSFACDFSGEEGPEVTVRLFIKGGPIPLSLS